ncbi:MAG: hypothetical protein ACTSVE_13820 [Candidatus Helarchaeota archaeon]
MNRETIKNWYLNDDWWHFTIGFAIIYILGLILELTGYWWTMIIAAAVGGVIIKHGGKSIIAGFFGILLVWATYLLNLASLGYSNPMLFYNFLNIIGAIIGINGVLLVILCLLIGGLVGLVGAVNAAYLTQIIIKLITKEEELEEHEKAISKKEKI